MLDDFGIRRAARPDAWHSSTAVSRSSATTTTAGSCVTPTGNVTDHTFTARVEHSACSCGSATTTAATGTGTRSAAATGTGNRPASNCVSSNCGADPSGTNCNSTSSSGPRAPATTTGIRSAASSCDRAGCTCHPDVGTVRDPDSPSCAATSRAAPATASRRASCNSCAGAAKGVRTASTRTSRS